ncbi:hypothetical protein Gotur_019581 [Gossypium turneri]
MVRVGWDRMCLSRKLGGASVVNLKVKNRALMAKWRWRFAMEKNALWRKVIKSKYGSSKHNWRLKITKTKEMSVVWCGIVENSKSEVVSKWIGQNCFRWVLGNGKRCYFGRMCGAGTGHYKFEEVQWDRDFSRKLLDRESCMVDRLKSLVGTLELIADVEDQIFWIQDSGGILYFVLEHAPDWSAKKLMVSGDCGVLLDCVAILECDWWSWPVKCCVGRRSIRVRYLVWDLSPMGKIKFNVAGVVMNEVAACGGVLRDDKGVVSALFFSRCVAGGLEMAVLMAIKEVAKMVIELIQKEQVPLIIEYDSITVSDWLKYSHLQPWSFRNLFANIEGSLR